MGMSPHEPTPRSAFAVLVDDVPQELAVRPHVGLPLGPRRLPHLVPRGHRRGHGAREVVPPLCEKATLANSGFILSVRGLVTDAGLAASPATPATAPGCAWPLSLSRRDMYGAHDDACSCDGRQHDCEAVQPARGVASPPPRCTHKIVIHPSTTTTITTARRAHARPLSVASTITVARRLYSAAQSIPLDAIVQQRDGLPKLASTLRDGSSEPLRVCFLGGSVTEQRSGYRPRVTQWLTAQAQQKRVRVEEVPAFCGNCGSKVLAFMVADWVISRKPHLVFIELCINDGDTLLETDDEVSLGSALEGIIRHVRDALPNCELCLLYMFLRDDLPLHQRTGSKAWADNDALNAVQTYHARIPSLHNRVAAHYGVPLNQPNPSYERNAYTAKAGHLRDDCHMHDPGAAFAASAICAALQAVIIKGDSGRSDHAIAKLPPPLHARPWGRGRREEVQPKHLSLLLLRPFAHHEYSRAAGVTTAACTKAHSGGHGPTRQYAAKGVVAALSGKDRAEFAFKGTRLGILTMIGPDSCYLVCEIDGGKWRQRINLCDKWSYFWRLAVVSLVEDELPKGEHVAVLYLEAEVPDRSVWNKQPSGPFWQQVKAEGKEHKLWLMHWLVEEESEKERAVVRREATAQAAAPPQPGARLGGAGLATGGRRADP